MPVHRIRRWLLVASIAVSLIGLGGCGGNETGTQVEVDQEKADALTNSMAGYYAKKEGKSKSKPAPASAPKPAP